MASIPPVRSWRPSGLHATIITGFPWPVNMSFGNSRSTGICFQKYIFECSYIPFIWLLVYHLMLSKILPTVWKLKKPYFVAVCTQNLQQVFLSACGLVQEIIYEASSVRCVNMQRETFRNLLFYTRKRGTSTFRMRSDHFFSRTHQAACHFHQEDARCVSTTGKPEQNENKTQGKRKQQKQQRPRLRPSHHRGLGPGWAWPQLTGLGCFCEQINCTQLTSTSFPNKNTSSMLIWIRCVPFLT